MATPAAESKTPDPWPPAPAASIVDVNEEPAALPPAPAEPELPPPSVSTAELPITSPEPAAVAPAAPAAQEPGREADLVASEAAPLADDTLDLASLQTRLRKTKAISLRTKLAVKKESEELLERFRAYHAEHGTASLVELPPQMISAAS